MFQLTPLHDRILLGILKKESIGDIAHDALVTRHWIHLKMLELEEAGYVVNRYPGVAKSRELTSKGKARLEGLSLLVNFIQVEHV